MKTKIILLSALALTVLFGCKKEDNSPSNSSSSSTTPSQTEQSDKAIYPSAYFSYSIDNLTVSVTSTSTNAYAILWEWGDGAKTSGVTRSSHTYRNSGTYTIRLTVTSSTGHNDYATAKVTVSKPVPTKVKITSLRLDKFPAAPSSGAWDVAGKPDIYFKIMDGNNTVTYYTSLVKDDVSNYNCPLYFNGINCTLYNINMEYIFKFYDEDITTDEFMAGCLWTPSDGSDNYNSSDRWYNNTIDMDFTIFMTWYSASGEALYSSSAQFKDGAWTSDDPETSKLLVR